MTINRIHSSPVAERTDGLECRWTLYVTDKGWVETSRTIPYDGQRYYSTRNLPNYAEKSSRYGLSVEEVIERHAAECDYLGMDVSVDELRADVLAVLRRDDVPAAGAPDIDLLGDA